MRPAAALLAGCLLATPALAQQAQPDAPVKVRVFLGGGATLGSLDYTESRSFPVFAEDATLAARFSASSGFALDAGLEYRFTGRWGVQLAVSTGSRSADATFTAQIPHPFFFNQPRELSGSLASKDYSETAAHLDLVLVAASSPRLDVSLFAGVSAVNVSAQLLGDVGFEQAYPYDEATLGSTPVLSASDTPIGFNAGASVDVRLSHRFGLGAQLRFTAASAELAPLSGAKVTIDAGGPAATVGLRVYF